MKRFLIFTLLCFTSFFADAQISLFKDINSAEEGSYPSNFIELNGTVFFTVKNYSFDDYKLWKTDGTESGTVQVSEQNINAYPSTSRKFLLLTTDTHLYYGVKHGDSYYAIDIWKTDGITNTLMVENISTNADLIVLNNSVYYLETGIGLFKINQNGGSTLVKSLTFNSSEKASIINNEIFFFIEGFSGTQLWKSDGTEVGTLMIQTFDSELFNMPGNSQERTRSIPINNNLFFFLSKYNNRTSKFEGTLWKSDGSSAGTILIKQVVNTATIYGITLNSFTNFNGNLIFNLGVDLWISNGTEQGTQLLKTFQGFNNHSFKRNFGILGNKFFFSASIANNDYELWESDGTIAGTKFLKDLHSGQSSKPDFFVPFGNRLLFRANNGNELWQTDGTADGTAFIQDIAKPNPNEDIKPEFIYTSNNVLLFHNYDPQHNYELWKSDGSLQNTGLLKNIATGSSSSGTPQLKVKAGNVWYFFAKDYRGSELWKSDGTPEGTTIVKEIAPGPEGLFMIEIVAVGNIVYFTFRLRNDFRIQLWRTDGTEANTYEIMLNSEVANVDVNPYSLTAANNRLFFVGYRSGSIISLWTVDGNQATFIDKSDIPGFYPKDLIGANNKLYFINNNNAQIWESDGTAAGTKSVYTIAWNAINLPRRPTNLIEFKNKLYFVSEFTNENQSNVDGLFEVSGPNNETKIIKEFDFDQDLTTNYIPFMKKTAEKLFFRTKPKTLDIEKTSIDLWTSDGTNNGTLLLKTLIVDRPERFEAVSVNNKLFIFSVPLSLNGVLGIWATDGTASGTQYLVKTNIKAMDEGVGFNNKLYFSQYDKDHGTELWTSDGTLIGTYIVDEVKKGEADSFVSNFLNFDDKIVFWAHDELNGNEPRAYSTLNCEGNRNYSIKSGSWDSPDTWSCGHIPTKDDVVIIKSGHNISIPLNYRAFTNILLTETGSVLNIPANAIIISAATIP